MSVFGSKLQIQVYVWNNFFLSHTQQQQQQQPFQHLKQRQQQQQQPPPPPCGEHYTNIPFVYSRFLSESCCELAH